MVYLAGERYDNRVSQTDTFGFSDPTLLQAAQKIYQTYYEVHPDYPGRPLGIAIDRLSHRGHLIFRRRPALLPKECFVTLQQLESGMY